MTAAMTEVSVVICAYSEERWDDLVAAIASVKNQAAAAREIIVVVDHNPALLARARAAWPDVISLKNQNPIGLSGARNTGIAAAQASIIAFLDDDAQAAPDWLARLSEGYADPYVMGVGGAIEPAWSGGRPGWFPEEFDWVVGCTYRGLPLVASPVRNLIGCNMSFRREIFENVGGFVEGLGRIGTLPLGCEETELCIRARRRWPQRELIYQPLARVQHQVPSQRASWRYFRARCFAEGISKAAVSLLVGAADGLASERAYTLRTLPRGVARGLADAVLRRGRPGGMSRAVAIVGGLLMTTAGYLKGIASARLARPRAIWHSQNPIEHST